MTRVYSIAFSGGPCGGKTTALPMVRDYFVAQDIPTMIAPEAATILFTNGYDPRGRSEDSGQNLDDGGQFLQDQIIKLQIAMEDQWKNILRSSGAKEAVLLCDRGTMDGPAFTTPDAWRRILESNQWTEDGLHNRYSAIIHMVTAACGAEKFFGNANNKARKEDPVTARHFDMALRRSWSGHKSFILIDNSFNSFEDKVDATILAASDVVERERAKQ